MPKPRHTNPLTARQAPHSQATLFAVNTKYGYAHRLEHCLILVAVCIVLLPPRATTIAVTSTGGIIVHL